MRAQGAGPLRLMIFDRTCTGGARGLPGLSAAWSVGGRLYGALSRFSAFRGVASWAEGLDWLVETSRGSGRPIAEVQFWGHGRRGCARVAKEALDASSLEPGHAHHPSLAAVREQLLAGGEALWWFRTCETFGGAGGQAFARAFSRFLGCRVAGHTYVIGFWQSGLHLLAPGDEPGWSVGEGFRRSRPRTPPRSRPGDDGATAVSDETALGSSPLAPRTITCLQGAVPRGF